jgi:hypothetical protein
MLLGGISGEEHTEKLLALAMTQSSDLLNRFTFGPQLTQQL